MLGNVTVIRCAVAVSACLLTSPCASTDDLHGAAATIEQIRLGLPEVQAAPEPQPKTAFETFAERLEAFDDERERLQPAVAATRWLELLDRYHELADDPGSGFAVRGQPRRSHTLLINVLPSPEAWEMLAASIRRRPIGEGRDALRAHCLRLFAAVLLTDEPAQDASMHALDEIAAAAEPYRRQSLSERLNKIASSLVNLSDDPGRTVSKFERQMAYAEWIKDSSEGDPFFDHLQVPDLVPFVGEVEATRLLRRAVLLPILLKVPTGEQTASIARRLALEQIDALALPQWALCYDRSATSLYEALEERFTRRVAEQARADAARDPQAFVEQARRSEGRSFSDHESDEARAAARWHYLMGLISEGRLERARTIAGEITEREGWVAYHMLPRESKLYTAWWAMARSEHAGEAADFFQALLEADPSRPFWEAWLPLVRTTEQVDHAIQLLMTSDDLPRNPDTRQSYERELRRMLATVGREDDLITRLRDQMADSSGAVDAVAAARDLAKIGSLIDRRQLLDDAARTLRAIGAQDPRSVDSDLIWTAQLIDRFGDGPAAEALLAECLRRQRRDPQRSRRFAEASAPLILRALAGVYHRAGRHEDVLILANEATAWAARDLAEIARESFYGPAASQQTRLTVAIAAALADHGRKAEARLIAEAVLFHDPDAEGAYEVLVSLDGPDAVLAFGRLSQHDRLNPRPRIWTARALLGAGRVDEAAVAILEAMKSGPLRARAPRREAHAVLADVREAQGRSAEAERHRRVVRALDRAHEADQLCAAGLLDRGVKAYQEALALDETGGEVRLRLAAQLDAWGRSEQAEAAYRRGFSELTASFGTLDQGVTLWQCRRWLDSAAALRVARDILPSAAEAEPHRPSLHVLAGMVREKQGRHEDALSAYRRAIAIDPEYPAACECVSRMAHVYPVPTRERDAARIVLWRLQMFQSSTYLPRRIRDMRQLWNTVASITPFRIDPPETLLPLAAARDQLDELAAEYLKAGQPSPDQFAGVNPVNTGGGNRSWRERSTPTPAAVIAGQNVIREIVAVWGTPMRQ